MNLKYFCVSLQFVVCNFLFVYVVLAFELRIDNFRSEGLSLTAG
jgi:hypothetical protein